MSLRGLIKPEYLLHPAQIFRRVYWSVFPPKVDRIVVRLPWQWPIEVDPKDEIGKSLLYLGVYELAVTEVLCRLCDEGETALDIGANIGYMTAILAKRVGETGKVLCFEAHPANEKELRSNVTRWADIVGENVIQIFGSALSDYEGSVQFASPPGFHSGLGRIVSDKESEGDSVLTIPCFTLDGFLKDIGNVGVAKLDVEGHEEAVLRGGQQAIESRRIRDWVFEHHFAYPSSVTDLFESRGYKVFKIQKSFWKPKLVGASTVLATSGWESQNFLATLDVDRAFSRMQSAGWQSRR